jgi:hypothetical protein
MYWLTEAPGEEEARTEARQWFKAACAHRNELPEDDAGHFDGEAYKTAQDAGRSISIDDHEFYPGRTPEYIKRQNAVAEAHQALDNAHASYFRFNIWGMSAVCQIMYHIGMLFTDEQLPDWPKAAAFGVDEEDVYALENADDDYYEERRAGMSAETREAAQRCAAAVAAYRATHAREIPGIPDHKFSSNDGWHVLPAECAAAVKIYMDWLDEVGPEAARNYIESNFSGRGFDRWNEWVAWIGQAAKHGGFKVH